MIRQSSLPPHRIRGLTAKAQEKAAVSPCGFFDCTVPSAQLFLMIAAGAEVRVVLFLRVPVDRPAYRFPDRSLELAP